MVTNKIKILTFVGYYLPGYKSGGPLRTITHMVEQLSDDFEFWIVTRDRDLGDKAPYPNISVGKWEAVGNSRVMYLSPSINSICFLRKLLIETPHDILYLNSFFEPNFTIKPLCAYRLIKKINRKSLVVAPRGEFSNGALKLKRLKKVVYIVISKLIGLYKETTFHASSEYEAEDIINILKIPANRIKVAIDLPQKVAEIHSYENPRQDNFLPGTLKIIFLSRISPKKNLDFALQVLTQTASNIQFDIYGPKEDFNYWAKCQKLISLLPKNVTVSYRGIVVPAEVNKVFSQYDLFFFPTRGENYGHVIAESLTAGTPVLISNQTPWLNLDADGLGWDIALCRVAEFTKIIEHYAGLSPETRFQQRKIVQARVFKRLENPETIVANKNLFYSQLHNWNG